MYMQLIKIGVKNLWQRKLNALAAILAFSGVIFIFSIMLALSNGLQSMANSESAVSLAVIVKSGAQNEGLSSLNRDSQIKLLDTLSNQFSIKQVSVEAVMSLNLNASAIEQEVPIVLRGMHLPDASARQMTLVSGHWFTAGSDGVVLGQKLASRYPGLTVGQQIQLGPRSWTVVGIFDAGSQFFNGEIWADLDSLRTSYQRGSSAQSLYFKLPHNHALPDIAKVLEEQVSDPIDLLPATELVARQMQQLTDFLNLILVSLSSLMFVGLILGGISIMESNFSHRQGQLNTLLALGVKRTKLAMGLVTEGGLLGLLAGAIGVLVMMVMFSGESFATSLQSGQLIIELHADQRVWAISLMASTLLGVVSAALPSCRIRFARV